MQTIKCIKYLSLPKTISDYSTFINEQKYPFIISQHKRWVSNQAVLVEKKFGKNTGFAFRSMFNSKDFELLLTAGGDINRNLLTKELAQVQYLPSKEFSEQHYIKTRLKPLVESVAILALAIKYSREIHFYFNGDTNFVKPARANLAKIVNNFLPHLTREANCEIKNMETLDATLSKKIINEGKIVTLERKINALNEVLIIKKKLLAKKSPDFSKHQSM